MSKQVLLVVRDQTEELKVRKHMNFGSDTTTVAYRTKSEEIADDNGITRMIVSANPEADAAVREATRKGTPVYATNVFLDNADGVGAINYINLWALENKSKIKPPIVHCFLANVKDKTALERIKSSPDFIAAFGIGGQDEEEQF
jgi:hypothetical protein